MFPVIVTIIIGIVLYIWVLKDIGAFDR